ncbi:hypothetical protein IKW73_03200 [Candidatus Saccharibacteria bacterium]|nr:hypothetical protein [Candidatus Saccharibacteria bacterium]
MSKRMYDKLNELIEYGYTLKDQNLRCYFDPFGTGLMVLKGDENIALWLGGMKVFEDEKESDRPSCYEPGIWEPFVDNLLEHEEDNCRWPGAGARDNKTLEQLCRLQAEANRRRMEQITEQIIKLATRCGTRNGDWFYFDYWYEYKKTYEDGPWYKLKLCYSGSQQFSNSVLAQWEDESGSSNIVFHRVFNEKFKINFDFANGVCQERGPWEATLNELYYQLSKK